MTATRFRCAACGNLTRFDVTATRTTRAFHHYTVGGDLAREDEQILAETVVEVSCRWCGHGREVEVVDHDGRLVAGSVPGTPAAGDGAAGDAAHGAPAGPGRSAAVG